MPEETKEEAMVRKFVENLAPIEHRNRVLTMEWAELQDKKISNSLKKKLNAKARENLKWYGDTVNRLVSARKATLGILLRVINENKALHAKVRELSSDLGAPDENRTPAGIILPHGVQMGDGGGGE